MDFFLLIFVDKEGDVLDLAANIDIVNKSGAWYSYGDLRLGQGRENAKQYIKEHPELMLEIENKVREHYSVQTIEEHAFIYSVTMRYVNIENVKNVHENAFN